MTDINLNSLSFEELRALEKNVAKTIKNFEERRRKETLSKVEAIAKEAGFTLADLLDSVKPSSKTALPPKYRHPENADLTWSGRGRQPAWYKEAIEAGVTERELLVMT
ncbi:trans-acting regulatory protein hvrA [Jannaschia pagri]|uniref:Trans-acting regulatory protein hvrA n=1 Tax=Jannaschia pagri TaxID=2829797 RepID=A0ABQ4NRY6_9RHOB|nr:MULTISPECIES: H-NS histone family protein [unclassified Jannaschia]GIT93315.1 trans-acting regulatory protein hvrA [Jannaschia sp. AI_61]GIT97111.1 trans-acting regulatory protein hvrA [Jannaschia sp. AI_62]